MWDHQKRNGGNAATSTTLTPTTLWTVSMVIGDHGNLQQGCHLHLTILGLGLTDLTVLCILQLTKTASQVQISLNLSRTLTRSFSTLQNQVNPI